MAFTYLFEQTTPALYKNLQIGRTDLHSYLAGTNIGQICCRLSINDHNIPDDDGIRQLVTHTKAPITSLRIRVAVDDISPLAAFAPWLTRLDFRTNYSHNGYHTFPDAFFDKFVHLTSLSLGTFVIPDIFFVSPCVMRLAELVLFYCHFNEDRVSDDYHNLTKLEITSRVHNSKHVVKAINALEHNTNIVSFTWGFAGKTDIHMNIHGVHDFVNKRVTYMSLNANYHNPLSHLKGLQSGKYKQARRMSRLFPNAVFAIMEDIIIPDFLEEDMSVICRIACLLYDNTLDGVQMIGTSYIQSLSIASIEQQLPSNFSTLLLSCPHVQRLRLKIREYIPSLRELCQSGLPMSNEIFIVFQPTKNTPYSCIDELVEFQDKIEVEWSYDAMEFDNIENDYFCQYIAKCKHANTSVWNENHISYPILCEHVISRLKSDPLSIINLFDKEITSLNKFNSKYIYFSNATLAQLCLVHLMK